jgi:hypothetical protein
MLSSEQRARYLMADEALRDVRRWDGGAARRKRRQVETRKQHQGRGLEFHQMSARAVDHSTETITCSAAISTLRQNIAVARRRYAPLIASSGQTLWVRIPRARCGSRGMRPSPSSCSTPQQGAAYPSTRSVRIFIFDRHSQGLSRDDAPHHLNCSRLTCVSLQPNGAESTKWHAFWGSHHLHCRPPTR